MLGRPRRRSRPPAARCRTTANVYRGRSDRLFQPIMTRLELQRQGVHPALHTNVPERVPLCSMPIEGFSRRPTRCGFPPSTRMDTSSLVSRQPLGTVTTPPASPDGLPRLGHFLVVCTFLYVDALAAPGAATTGVRTFRRRCDLRKPPRPVSPGDRISRATALQRPQAFPISRSSTMRPP